MANLFFIHTPLQLMIAQMIIEQEKLTDNVMLCGYVDDNRHFFQLYDMIRIEKMWKSIEQMEDVARWALFPRRKIFSAGFHTYKRYCYIRRIIEKHHIDTLFLGDMWNISCQLAAMSFHKKGLKISFFEEGCGHYIKPINYGKAGDIVDKIFAFFLDLFYFRPLYGVSYYCIHYFKGFTLLYLPMDVRYSVVPFYQEKCDKLLTVKPAISEKLAMYISSEIEHIGRCGDVLLLTSPLYEERYKKDEDAYVYTIINYFRSMNKKTSVHIKFHPREKEHIRKRILMEFAKADIDFIVLGSDMNIPAEYYLQYIHYKKVVVFLSSTSFYNGYLFPEVKFVYILEDYYNNCKAADSQSINWLKPLLKEIPKE